MDTLTFKACYEAPYFAKKPVLPWKVAASKPFQRCFLDGEMTLEAMGLFVVALAEYGYSGHDAISGMDKDAVISLIIERDSPVVAGGISVQTGNVKNDIVPGCCCGLESWREWFRLLDDGCVPWMGHDPSPGMARVDQGMVKIWQDDEMSEYAPKKMVYVKMTEAAYTQNLKQVERDMLGFLDVLETWALHENIAEIDSLVDTVDKTFDIRPNYMQADWWKKYNK